MHNRIKQLNEINKIEIDENLVEEYAKAMWDTREEESDGVAMGARDARLWDAYKEGKENFDCGRFEYDRDDHRRLVRGMFRRLKLKEGNTI